MGIRVGIGAELHGLCRCFSNYYDRIDSHSIAPYSQANRQATLKDFLWPMYTSATLLTRRLCGIYYVERSESHDREQRQRCSRARRVRLPNDHPCACWTRSLGISSRRVLGWMQRQAVSLCTDPGRTNLRDVVHYLPFNSAVRKRRIVRKAHRCFTLNSGRMRKRGQHVGSSQCGCGCRVNRHQALATLRP